MWDILRQSLVTAPETDDLNGIGDLDLIAVNSGLYLFATTRSVPGITVLSVDSENHLFSLNFAAIVVQPHCLPSFSCLIFIKNLSICSFISKNEPALIEHLRTRYPDKTR